MNKEFIPYGRHCIGQDDIDTVVEVLKGDWLTTGPYVEKFENSLLEKIKAKFAVACSNGTAALHLAAIALGLKKGDAIIVPAVTFTATANAARFCGADVIFSDVNPETGLMEVKHLEKALQEAEYKGFSVKAVFPVHLNGQCVNLEELYPLCLKNNLRIVVDACHALGGVNCGCNIGSEKYADMTCFSFHPVKTIAMGEGGAITTNNEEYAAKLKNLRTHGITKDSSLFVQKDLAFDDDITNPWYYEMQDLGYNYRASDINCALGFSQMKKLEEFSKIRRQIAKDYDEKLQELAPTMKPVAKVKTCDPVLHLYVALIDFEKCSTTKAKVMNALKKQGIGTQVHYLPICHQPYYRKLYGKVDVKGADEYYEKCLSLPFYVGMPEDTVKKVVSSLKKVLKL